MNPIYQFLKENKLTTKDEKAFERDYSDSTKAKELHRFFQENKLTTKGFNSFYDTYLKKKEGSVVSLTGGTLGTSEVPSVEKPPKGFEGLKPAKIQPTQVFEEKGVGEATMLTRKMERAQKQAISGTGVRLPAAPKAVAAERGMQRAIEPMVEKQVIKDETPKVERFFKGGFGKFLDILDTPGISIIPLGDFIDDIGRSLEAGRKQGSTIMPSIELMKSGAKSSPEDIKNFIEVSKNVGQVPPSDEMLKFRDVYEKEGKGVWGFVKGLAQNPGVAPQIMASSISALVTNPASMATFGSIVGGGAAIGAATGPGALATAAASLPYAMGAATGVLETGATFAELLQDELNKKKLDFTEDNVRRILEDEKTLSSLRARAATRGAVIGTFDALTGRIAGKVGAKIPTSTPAGRVKSGLASAGIEAVGGATGEAAARKIIGQEMDVAEIGLEGIAQTPTTAVSIASEIYGKPSYKINGELRTKADVEEILNNAPSEEIKNVKIEVSNDPITEAQVKERVETGDIKRELKEVAPEMSDEKAERIASLERQLKKFEQGTTQISKDKAAAIKEEIKNISKETEAVPTAETVSRIETEFKPVEKAPKVSAAPIEAFRDVESTTKALNKFRWDNPKVEKITELSPNIYAEFEGIAEDYHQFKKEGSNPEFVKAVEDLLVGEVAPEAAPQVPTTEEKTYRVEYFDPETRKMTHQMFATEAEGEAFKNTLTREQTSQGVTSYFEKAPAKGVGEVVTEAAPQAPATPEAQKESIQNVIKQEGLDISPNQLDRLYDEAVKGGGKIEDSQIRKILNVGYLKAIRIAEDINDLGVGEVEAAPQVPAAPVEALKDVESTVKALEERRIKKGEYEVFQARLGPEGETIYEYSQAIKPSDVKEFDGYFYSETPSGGVSITDKSNGFKVVEGKSKKEALQKFQDLITKKGGLENLEAESQEILRNRELQFAESYQKAKAEGTSPELVKAVEDLLVGEVAPKAAPEVPAAPEKTQDEVAKEQTRETDLLLGGQAEQRRKGGKYTKDGVEYVRNPKGQGLTSEVSGEVRFTNDVSLPFKYKLVEAETLQPSHQDGIRNPLHFIPEAQPKNRNDVGSLQAEESFANNPRFSELGENTNAYSGAPVVNERGEVVQGNNRSAGLRKGYQRNNPQYKNDLAANAEQFGFTREQVEGMKNPVLVREIAVSDQGAIELGNYDAKDLETGGKRRVDPIAVTRRMPFDIKGRIADLFTGEETLNQAIRANQKRLLELLNPYLNQAQRNTITKEGVLTDAGIKDLEAVVQQFLFDNGDTALPDLFENLSATQKEGLRKSLPYVFSVSPEKSLVPDIQEAILAVNDFNASGAGEFDAWLLQGDIFNDGKTPKDKYTPLELAIAKTLVESKTQKEIAKKFADYADVVKDKEADMFEAARPGRSRKEGVLEIFKTEDYAKPISERGRKEVTPKEKPTPKPSPEKRAGDAARSLAERIRAGKINKEGFRASTGFDVVWDAALEIVASSLEAGASVADAVQDGLKYIRTTDWYKNLTDKKDFEDKFTNRLNEEYNAIQVGGPKEVPVGEVPRGRGKVESGVPPTKPPKAPKEGEAEGRKEERRFTERMIKSPGLLAAAKKGIAPTLEYVRQTNAMTVDEAQQILNVLGEDKAYNAMKDPQTKGAVRVVLGQVLIKRYNQLAKEATTQEDKDLYIGATVDIAEYVTVSLATEAGQTIQAFSLWDKLTPEAQLVAASRQKKKSAKKNVEKVRKDVDSIGEKFDKANEEAVKEILKTEEVSNTVKKDSQEGVQKAKDKAAKARKKRADIINKYKGKGGITLSTGGLTKEGIEFVGEVALTYIEEGIAEVQVIVEKVLADIKNISGKEPNETVKREVLEIADKTLAKSDIDIVKSVKDKKMRIDEVAIQHFTSKERVKKNLAQKFMDQADMSESNAEALAKRFEEAFDRVVSRKKAEILAKNKKRFERIRKAINDQAAVKAEPKTLQDEIIKYSNLGAFDTEDMLQYLAEKFKLGQLTKEQAAKIKELAEKIQTAPEGSPKREATEDLLAYQANLNGGNWGEVAQGIWYANILSGYRTHEKNVVSTFINSWVDLGAEIIADPKSAPYIIAGYINGVRQRGLLEASRTLVTGRSPIHVSKIEVPEALERIRFIGGGYNPANWFKYVGRAMKAEDVLSFQGLKEARAYQLARREASKLGFNTWSGSGWKKVNELLFNTKERFEIAAAQAESEGVKPNTKNYKRRIYELMENSRPIQMTEDAYNFAAHGTFNYESDGTLGAFTNAVSKALDVKVGNVQPARFVVPFTRIITNVVNNALDYSPIGLVRAIKGSRGFKSLDDFSITKGTYKPFTPEQRRIVAIKSAIGISFATIIQYMAETGMIEVSGGGPEDEKKKAQLRESGWQPYSIKIGDKWYSYQLTPLVMVLGMIGNFNDAAKYGKEDEQTLLRRMSVAALKFGGMISDLTWINSAATFLGSLTEPKIAEQQRQVEQALGGMARGFVPFSQITSQTTQAYNKIFQVPAKQVNNSWEAFYQDIPIARNSLNDKINALGEPVIKDIDIMVSREKADPVWKFLTEKQGWVAPLSKKTVFVFDEKLKQDRPLTGDEFYNLSKRRGELIKEDVQKIMKEGYPIIRNGVVENVLGEDMTPKELNDILSKRIEPLATKRAKAQVFGIEDSEKEDEDDDVKKELTELEKEWWGLNEE